MTFNEAVKIAIVIEKGAAIEGHDNVRDMCEDLNNAKLGFIFTFDEDDFSVGVAYAKSE